MIRKKIETDGTEVFEAFLSGDHVEKFPSRESAERWLTREWTREAHRTRRNAILLAFLVARRNEVDENECPQEIDDEIVRLSSAIRDGMWVVLTNHPVFVLLADAASFS